MEQQASRLLLGPNLAEFSHLLPLLKTEEVVLYAQWHSLAWTWSVKQD